MNGFSGRGVVVTRPATESKRIADLIRAAGGQPILFPGIAIVPIENQEALFELLDRLDRFDLAIFISPSAVTMAFELIDARGGWPPRLKIAAIGAGCVRALQRHGIQDAEAPAERFDSEALLELPSLRDVVKKNIVIFRGIGGRELLADELTARGAHVEYAECYRRAKPVLDPAPLLKAWEQGKLHAITASSSEALRNVAEIVGSRGAKQFRHTPCFVSHPRIAKIAYDLGIEQTITSGQGDESMLRALTGWFEQQTK
jgi:uroporphyrinogen-III synthase